MLLQYIDNWLLFTIVFGLLLVVTFIMTRLGGHFYTKDIVLRKFSIMELEIPAKPRELVNLIKGLYFPGPQSGRSVSALRRQLKIDFLFMPLAYGSVFLLCWKVAHKTGSGIVHEVFLYFAWLQLVPWICDIIENIYLLGKIRPDLEMPADPKQQEKQERRHKYYLVMEALKWGLSLTAAVSAISAICYYWLTGNYTFHSFIFLLIAAGEIIIFLVAGKLSARKQV
jgi:hypothetical protein